MAGLKPPKVMCPSKAPGGGSGSEMTMHPPCGVRATHLSSTEDLLGASCRQRRHHILLQDIHTCWERVAIRGLAWAFAAEAVAFVATSATWPRFMNFICKRREESAFTPDPPLSAVSGCPAIKGSVC